MSKTFRRYPRGKLVPHDEGAVTVAIGVKEDCVVMQFPHPVKWLAMPAEQAEELAQTILARAKDARRNRQ